MLCAIFLKVRFLIVLLRNNYLCRQTMLILSDVKAPTERVRLSLPDVKAFAEETYGGEGTLTVSEK